MPDRFPSSPGLYQLKRKLGHDQHSNAGYVRSEDIVGTDERGGLRYTLEEPDSIHLSQIKMSVACLFTGIYAILTCWTFFTALELYKHRMINTDRWKNRSTDLNVNTPHSICMNGNHMRGGTT